MSADTEPGGARRIRGAGDFWQNLGQQHRDALHRALTRLRRAPVSAAIGVLLISFAWLLPLLVHWLERNLAAMTDALAASHGAQVFLKVDFDEAQAEALAQRWRQDFPNLRTQVISRSDGLKELGGLPGFRSIDSLVGDNPLPVVISLDVDDSASLPEILEQLKADPASDFIQSDALLKQKLKHLQDFVARAAWIAWLLALAGALLISIHLSRMAVNADRDEISVAYWLGANDAYIRRPLLYGGVLQGFIGAGLAAILVLSLVAATHRALLEFSQQFAGNLVLFGPAPAMLLTVVGVAAVLGWLGAFVCTSIDLGQLGQTREESE